jgi:hypothetical protein
VGGGNHQPQQPLAQMAQYKLKESNFIQAIMLGNIDKKATT